MKLLIRTIILMSISGLGLNSAQSQALRMKDCPGSMEAYLFALSPALLKLRFDQLSLDAQYKLYVCGSQYMHPPALHLIMPFAAQGAPVATYLKERLAEGVDDLTARDILQVFVEMQREGTYAVSQDAGLMHDLRNRIDEIRDRGWRKYTQSEFERFIGK